MVRSKKSNDDSALSGSKFKQLLWRAGYVTIVGGQVCIDIQRSCRFLKCSERTLRRWLAGTPCPRAAALLKLKERVIPKSWDGFHFNRQDRFVTPFHPHGLDKETILKIGPLSKDATRFEVDALYFKAQLEAARDENLRKTTRAKLAQAINTLQGVIADPLFLAPGERPTDKKQPGELARQSSRSHINKTN